MVTCWICARDFEAWAESVDDFEPTDWECPECITDNNAADEWPDNDDEYDDDWHRTCECGEHSIGDTCDCCGAPMCPRCRETKAGFCHGCPTKEWVSEQEKKFAGKLL